MATTIASYRVHQGDQRLCHAPITKGYAAVGVEPVQRKIEASYAIIAAYKLSQFASVCREQVRFLRGQTIRDDRRARQAKKPLCQDVRLAAFGDQGWEVAARLRILTGSVGVCRRRLRAQFVTLTDQPSRTQRTFATLRDENCANGFRSTLAVL